MKAAGIILAAGKGKRFGLAGVNKTSVSFEGKPLVKYGADLYSGVCEKSVVVVGVNAESVKEVLSDNDVEYAYQQDPKGTGDAFRTAMQKLEEINFVPEVVFTGYGDHMMFYNQKVLYEMYDLLRKNNAAVVLVTTRHEEPDKLAWGRIVRDSTGNVCRIVEQKDASDEDKKITELNPGFYCFDFRFARDFYTKFVPSLKTGEYYLTDMIAMAVDNGMGVAGLEVPFEKVGIGINTPEEKEKSEALYRQVSTIS